MIAFRKIALIIFILILICGILGLRYVRILHLDREIICKYRYEYYSEGNIKIEDCVELSNEDSKIIRRILNKVLFISDIYDERGFTESSSLTFLNQKGEEFTVLIRYPKKGNLRINGTTFDGFLWSENDKDIFFEVLENYHRYDQVLWAG